MTGDRAFFDTNVLIYLMSDDEARSDCAERLLAAGGVVSVQVLNEFAEVARRKLSLEWAEIREILATVRAVCRVEGLSIDAHDHALGISERYGYRIYDSLIIAAASLAGCTVLYSEDMQSGQLVDGVTIRNPFS